MVNSGKDVSVIICVYNAEKSILGTLKSVFRSSYKDLDVILVDDASTDSTVDICKGFPVKIIKLKENRGPAFSRNVGARNAKGKILIFLDSDVTFAPNLFNNMLTYMKEQPDIAGVGTISSPLPLNPAFYTRYFALQENQSIMQLFGKERYNYSNSICTRCGCLKKTVFEETGGFDENYKSPSVEDYDFNIRINGKHKILYDKTLLVNHYFPNSFLKIFRRYYRNASKLLQMMPLHKIKIKPPFKENASAWLLIFVSGILFISGIFWHTFLYGSLITFLIVIVIKRNLLKAFYKNEGFYFMIKGWFFYCFCFIPVAFGLISGFFKNIKRQFVRNFKNNAYKTI